MSRHAARIAAITFATLTLLTVLHKKPWQTAAAAGALDVGFLPVTCHLTCPVTDYATRSTTTGTRFESQRFTEFPTVVEALKARKIDATFLLAPLAMVLREQGVPIHIVYLGHRDGSTVIVPKDSPAKSIRDLRGKTFARPSRFSNQYLVITKLMEDEGMQPGDINFVDMPPPDMPSALAAGAIDAYFIGEPYAAKAELAGTGRVLYYAKDIWPRFVSCVLVVRDELIAERPEVVRDLVRGIAESGEWAEQNRLDAAKVAAPFFRQDQKLLEYVLTQPPDRVSYRQLTPTDEDLRGIMKYAIKANILKGPIDLSDLVDRRFIPAEIHPANIVPE
ncbi:MAG: ABC transporter substrate-binding protein [Deltaproteobacteria bacterium]|nr:ABC transporter substrate-binding protein [Deltaproteobacteria bacterium]